MAGSLSDIPLQSLGKEERARRVMKVIHSCVARLLMDWGAADLICNMLRGNHEENTKVYFYIHVYGV